MKAWIEKVRSGEFFGSGEIRELAADLLSPDAGDEEKAGFLEAFHARGESAEEIAFLASAFLEMAEPFEISADLRPFIDVCGTGGDKLGLFNISTAVMFVAAGAGLRVVKHGNRGVTSRSGGADVLGALGIPADLAPDKLAAMLEESGATFLFAPRFHPAFKSVAPARKLLAARGKASVFNMLGPLLNPARPAFQLAGVFSAHLVPLYADILPRIGRTRAWVVHGRAGNGVMDEISTLGPTTISEVSATGSRQTEFDASAFFPRPAGVEELRGGDAGENADILLSILSGARRGAARDIVLLNAAGALQAAGAAAGWEESLASAAESVDSGAAMGVLTAMRRVSEGS
jgi:anthranilate phosphoribosyltransferase